MKTEIIIVGAGHGGLVAASKLAKKGFKVHIYETKGLDKLSWDWGDAFNRNVFKRVGIPEPVSSQFFIPESYSFSSPNEQYIIETHIPLEERDISMERRALIKRLVEHATDTGAEIFFQEKVTMPIIKEEKIIGVKLKNSEVYGDLIIDSAGINTPIRSQLPNSYGLSHKLQRGEFFYTYRAYFKKSTDEKNWLIYLGYKYKPGIAWVNTSDNFADILIGRIDPFKKGEIEEILQDLRKKHLAIGAKLLRGGQVALIPIRRTASMLVGPNYALTGDAAFMTIPINGSGIANSMISGKILSDVVIDAHDSSKKLFTTRNLWPYQYKYYKEIGAEMAYIEVIKNFLITLEDFKDIDFLFKKKLLKGYDIESSVLGKELKVSFFDIIGRAIRGISRLGLLLDLASNIGKGHAVKKHYLNIPKIYDAKTIKTWIEKGEKYFKPYYDKLAEANN